MVLKSEGVKCIDAALISWFRCSGSLLGSPFSCDRKMFHLVVNFICFINFTAQNRNDIKIEMKMYIVN